MLYIYEYLLASITHKKNNRYTYFSVTYDRQTDRQTDILFDVYVYIVIQNDMTYDTLNLELIVARTIQPNVKTRQRLFSSIFRTKI